VEPVRVGLVGDRRPDVVAHGAIPKALELAARATGRNVETRWFATDAPAAEWSRLSDCGAVWCVPGSPYADTDRALAAIRLARELGTPFLGTCGGFQHALLEYARNVLGLRDADHAESNPDAALPLIAPLACSLKGASGRVLLANGSRVRALYGRETADEDYHCGYGLNARYRDLLDGGALRPVGFDENGEVRAVELAGHPFFVATLYQPERSALAGRAHPLIVAYVTAAAERAVL